jgi:DNA-binding transcriptional LysR family regulator
MGPAVDSVEEALEAVARGRGVCFVARSVAVFYGRPDVAFLPVEDLEDVPIALAWRRGEEQPAFLDFLARARDLANSDALTASIAAQQASPPAI